MCVIGKGKVHDTGRIFLAKQGSKGKFSQYQAMKPLRGSRGVALLFL